MNVDVSGANDIEIDSGELGDYAAAILDREGLDAESALSISFIDDETMAEMNSKYMGIDTPTDVLSFPIEDAAPNHPPSRYTDGPPLELGDIFICPTVVSSHADEYAVSFRSEMYLMVTHGVLHILGWDHQTEAEAEAMEAREAQHLETIGLGRR